MSFKKEDFLNKKILQQKLNFLQTCFKTPPEFATEPTQLNFSFLLSVCETLIIYKKWQLSYTVMQNVIFCRSWHSACNNVRAQARPSVLMKPSASQDVLQGPKSHSSSGACGILFFQVNLNKTSGNLSS